jgi:acyl carrier protein
VSPVLPAVSLRDQLVSVISRSARAQGLTDHTPLISSSLLDSLGLFQVILWIEKQIDRPIDLGAIDLVSQLNTISDILRFIGAS